MMKYLPSVFSGLALGATVTSIAQGNYVAAFWAAQAAFWALRFTHERNRND